MRNLILCILALIAFAILPSSSLAASTVSVSGTYTDWAHTWWGGDYTGSEPWMGYAPDDGKTHPVLIYTHGTDAEWSGAQEGDTFAKYAAASGFVSIRVIYNSAWTHWAGEDQHAQFIYSDSLPSSALNAACKLPQADCSKGVVVVGHSQGAMIAVRAANYSSRVRAAYVIGFAGTAPIAGDISKDDGGLRSLPNSRLRVVNGDQDTGTDYSSMQKATGHNCGTDPDCLDASGAGYYVVQDWQVQDGIADHCYPWSGCFAMKFDPNWLPPSAQPWGYQAALDFLKQFTG